MGTQLQDHRNLIEGLPRAEGAATAPSTYSGSGYSLERLAPSELIDLCLARSEEGWKEFLRRYSRLLYATIGRYDLPRQERDEAFLATVSAVYRQLPRLRHREKLVAWLIGISSRRAIDRIRLKRRELRVEEITDTMLRAGRQPIAPRALPDHEVLLQERAQQVREAMDFMPERCRRLFQALFYENPAPEYREIAHREGIAVGNIGPLRARCLTRLRAIFQKSGWL
jgi:RNA polymerase sigma factor (sigma-70 family)